MNKLKLLTSLIAVSSIFSLVSCGETKKESTFSLSDKNISLEVGEDFCLKALDGYLLVNNASEWKSSNEGVVVVNNGTIEAIGVGEATISCIYNNETVKCHINVVSIDRITTNKQDLLLQINDQDELYLLNNGKRINEGVTYRTSDTDIIEINNGVVKGLKIGTAVLDISYKGLTYPVNIEIVDKFIPVGDYFGSVNVVEMGGTIFEFDLHIDEDKTYEYSRRDLVDGDNIIKGELISEGNWIQEGVNLNLKPFNGKEFQFVAIKKNVLKSVGKIPTGHVDFEITLNKVLGDTKHGTI